MGSSQPHHDYIVMLPFMAHGHLIPFLALAKQIHQRTGFTLIIATTKRNVHYLRRSSSDSDIHFAELPFSSSDHGLPPDTETTENLPLSRVVDLFNASRSLEAPCRNFILESIGKHGRPPLCLVSDVFLGWAVDVARSFDTINVTFTTGGAYGSAAYASVWQNLPHRKTESDEFEAPGFPKRCRFHRTQLHLYLRAADGSDPWSRFFQPQISLSLKSHSWLCYTVEEIEPLGLEILRGLIKRPVWCVGPLLPPAALNDSSFSPSSSFSSISKQRVSKELGISAEKLFEWLDSQEPQSVLYISFGSQNTIGAARMMELAIGLEKSEKPFVWVIRPPFGFDLRGEFRPEWLPEGFEERAKAKNRGLLVRNWAPQLDILAHRSVGGFLSHCGWNSVMESLSQGVPIIGWPLAAEQAYNSKMLAEEKGVSVELTRGAQGAVVGDQVKQVIELVMDRDGEGGEMKKRANEVKLQIRAAMKEEGEHKGSALKAMDDFVASILSHREEKIPKIERTSA
ncbi:UDP-glucuronosyl/UDP-glucosyltransferase [Parasponia andersonii]|uniref:Glycosyltransferase n=1 Tax=Parasponia andersonii TaxID=3476 RepID=A0A2P5B8G2_PARAD|nr:UDP-glucuronosyl/UDP-glucosyltransferase [Parasponia andersonii]